MGTRTFMGPVKIKLLNDLIECSAMKKKSLKTLCAIKGQENSQGSLHSVFPPLQI